MTYRTILDKPAEIRLLDRPFYTDWVLGVAVVVAVGVVIDVITDGGGVFDALAAAAAVAVLLGLGPATARRLSRIAKHSDNGRVFGLSRARVHWITAALAVALGGGIFFRGGLEPTTWTLIDSAPRRHSEIAFLEGGCERFDRVRVRSGPRTVRVTVLVRKKLGPCTADLRLNRVTILLGEMRDRELRGQCKNERVCADLRIMLSLHDGP